MNSSPLSDELEVSLFGPGVGECIVVHYGDGQWMIIDSCLDQLTKTPIAITYLEEIGVNLSTDVKYIFVSHWHDDHIRGISELVKCCSSAIVGCSSAFLKNEFLTLVGAYSGRMSLVDRHTAGTRELANVIETLTSRVGSEAGLDCIATVGPNRLFVDERNEKYICNIKSLSPSDKSVSISRLAFSELIPSDKDERVVLTDNITPNHAAIALWIDFNGTRVLLGSDLEDTGDSNTGWTAILKSPVPCHGKASIFKIPHHGSPNGHNDDVWMKMLEEKPCSLLTSYSRGKTPRPDKKDIQRIQKYTDKLFYTSERREKLPKREPAVERTIRGMAKNRKALGGEMGHIQVRVNSRDGLRVNLIGPAIKL